eukprot:5628501-Prymnesium_polylepis.1
MLFADILFMLSGNGNTPRTLPATPPAAPPATPPAAPPAAPQSPTQIATRTQPARTQVAHTSC